MKRSWLILSVGFGIVIALIALLGFGAMRRAKTINDEMIAAHEKYLENEAVLNEIPAGLYLADILVRDYLLDPSQSAAPTYRQQLTSEPLSGHGSILSPPPVPKAIARCRNCARKFGLIGSRFNRCSTGIRRRKPPEAMPF